MQAVHTQAAYAYIDLYTYDWDFVHENNIPYSIDIVPTDFRCDGLAEWATEVALNPSNPQQSDGFYSFNLSLLNVPIRIKESPIDTIGTPDAPTLTKTDTHINASFSTVSGAWSEALYALYRSSVQSPYVADVIYCGHSRFYSDEITDDMEGEYFYYLKIGEQTASCSDTDTDFSEFSKYSSIKIEQQCKSPDLFEIVLQTDVNTSDWRVSVKNLETNETKEGVFPFNLDGSLYKLENDEWVLASCGGTTIDSNWTDQKPHEFHKLDNPQEEIIAGEDRCPSSDLFEVVSHVNKDTIDWRISVKNLETNETQEGVYPFNLDGNGSLYQLENEEWVLASCGGTEYSTEWLEQKEKEFYMLNNPQGEIIKKDDQNDSKEVLTRLNYTCAVDGRREDYFFDTTAWVRYQRSIWCFQENSRDDYSIFGDVDATIRDVVSDTTTRLIDARRGHDMVKLLYGDRIDYYFESKLNEVKDVYGDDKVDVTYFNSHDRSTPVDTIEPDCAIYEYPNPDYDYVPLVVTDCISYKLMKVTIYK